MEQYFIINDRFCVEPSANLITDRMTGNSNRLESRLMEVLCILLAAPGRTVLREELVKTVWLNYGGGDEGLTQAISGLRKALNDKDKTILQTVPKKGYLFKGTITKTTKAISTPRTGKKHIILTAGTAAAILLLIIYAVVKIPPHNPTVSSERAAIMTNSDTTNSVTCYDDKQNSYKWISHGDAQPEFYINNQQVPIGAWESHMTVINYLKHKLQEKMLRKQAYNGKTSALSTSR